MGIVHGSDGSLVSLGNLSASKAVAKLAHLIEAVFALILDIGGDAWVAALAAVDKVDDGPVGFLKTEVASGEEATPKGKG